jgi:hypothetical protein
MPFAKIAPSPAAPSHGRSRQAPRRRERSHGAVIAKSSPGHLTCSNCTEPYSSSEARVQRSLRQFFACIDPKPSAVTPRLCWVCSHLYYGAHQLDGMDRMWNEFEEGGLAQ